jgi:dTDP-L-rhamnose 4-epimerase
VTEVAQLLARAMGREDLQPEIAGKVRIGDVRHNIPDISKARAELGFAPGKDFQQGLAELAEWVARQQAVDRVSQARKELEARGLVA